MLENMLFFINILKDIHQA